MLKEIKKVAQKKNDSGHRRWFTDENLDLIVWYTYQNEIIGFQLCYDKKQNEHSITWDNKNEFNHNRIHSGEEAGGKLKQSPILVADGVFPQKRVFDLFLKNCKQLEFEIANFVIKKLQSIQQPV